MGQSHRRIPEQGWEPRLTQVSKRSVPEWEMLEYGDFVVEYYTAIQSDAAVECWGLMAKRPRHKVRKVYRGTC